MPDKNRNSSPFSDELSAYRQIKEVISNYPISPDILRRRGNSWLITSGDNTFLIKRFNHSIPEFFFVLSAVEYLREQGFSALPNFILNNQNQPVSQNQYGIFYITEGLNGTQVDANEIHVLSGITRQMAKMHRVSIGFSPPEPLRMVRQDWGDWEEKWHYRLDELYRLGEEAQHRKEDFDKTYLKLLDDALRDGVEALECLKRINFREITEEERARGGLCHRDYKPEYILEGEGSKYWLQDFDDLAGQSHLEDVARFIKEVGEWDANKINFILDEYSQIFAVSPLEIEAITAYLKLPLDLWRIARNYYLRGKPQKRSLRQLMGEMKRRRQCFKDLCRPKDVLVNIPELPWLWGVPPDTITNAKVEDFWSQWKESPVVSYEYARVANDEHEAIEDKGENSKLVGVNAGNQDDQCIVENMQQQENEYLSETERYVSNGYFDEALLYNSEGKQGNSDDEAGLSHEKEVVFIEKESEDVGVNSNEEESKEGVIKPQPQMLVWKAFPK